MTEIVYRDIKRKQTKTKVFVVFDRSEKDIIGGLKQDPFEEKYLYDGSCMTEKYIHMQH